MARTLALLLGLTLALPLAGCGGDTCESVQEEIQSIGRELQKDPKKAMEESTGRKLEALKDKLVDMGCLGG